MVRSGVVESHVVVDFDRGSISGLDHVAESVVEFIQEDRVTAYDDLAMLCMEAAAAYAAGDEEILRYVPLLRNCLANGFDE